MQPTDIPEAIYSPETPYSPPVASLENKESPPGHSLSPKALTHLAASRKWMLAAGVMLGVAWSVKLVAALLVAGTWYGVSAGMVIKSVFAAAGVVFVLAVPLPQLFRSARAIRRTREDGSDVDVVEALQAHRLFWVKLTYGLLLLTAGLYVLGLLILLIVNLL